MNFHKFHNIFWRDILLNSAQLMGSMDEILGSMINDGVTIFDKWLEYGYSFHLFFGV
jgi:hypothetical protein